MTDFADPQGELRRRHQARTLQRTLEFAGDREDNGIVRNLEDSFLPSSDAAASTRRNSDDVHFNGNRQPVALFRRVNDTIPTNNNIQDTQSAGSVESMIVSSNLMISRWYCLLSTVLMVLSILAASPPHSTLLSLSLVDSNHATADVLSHSESAAVDGLKPDVIVKGKASRWGKSESTVARRNANAKDVASDTWSGWISCYKHWWNVEDYLSVTEKGRNREKRLIVGGKNDISRTTACSEKTVEHRKTPWWAFRENRDSSQSNDVSSEEQDLSRIQLVGALLSQWMPVSVQPFLRLKIHQLITQWVDPVVLNPTSETPTVIIDKILTSTPRLLIIANFMLAMTYLLHSVVASWFLGPHHQGFGRNNGFAPRQQQTLPPGLVVDWSNSSGGARERMGGFLVFKLLLISAVVAPDTLDLLILLAWYTWLSCLRSLDHLAFTTTTYLSALGHPQHSGAVQLLFFVLGCTIVAAASCAALFRAAGIDTVLLLTCDCALLGADALSHILKYLQCALEDTHACSIRAMEARQLELHDALRNSDFENTSRPDDTVQTSLNMGDGENDHVEEELDERAASVMSNVEVHQESRRLDRRMEALEILHSKRLAILDSVIFSLDLICHLLTIAHFCHIWSLHGVQFTLIDGVLALHLHSAVSTACRKVAQRRNNHSIARDLQGQVPNATDEELRKASVAGDVCCICLGTMTSGGHVKKVKCGHLYHTHCLREVVERAQSMNAARCPLCRASLSVGGNATVPDNSGMAAIALPGGAQQAGTERALFRFSTESILPMWLPVPAFSFEVVRRPPSGFQETFQARQVQSPDAGENVQDLAETAEPQQQPQPSFFRRLLILAGAVPMSPEEEARALAQLVDMFPQYARSDLLRELRERGSPELVAESVLMGIFSGIPRGES